jgi:hypothetical protein
MIHFSLESFQKIYLMKQLFENAVYKQYNFGNSAMLRRILSKLDIVVTQSCAVFRNLPIDLQRLD